MKWTPLVVWVLTVVVILIGLAGLLSGAAGNSWWKIDNGKEKKDVGLWRQCYQDEVNGTFADQICTKRMNLLEFKDEDEKAFNREKDAVLLVLIVSASFSFFTFISILSMLCCQEELDQWKCGALITTLFAFISTICGFGALVFSEVELDDLWEKGYEHGWSVILAWVGSSLMGLAFILSFTLICVGAKEHESLEETYKHTNGYDRTGIASRGAHANPGYEMK